MKTLLCCTFLFLLAASSAFGKDESSADPIVGVWSLNLEKSKNPMPVPDSEVITIVAHDNRYKLTFDVKVKGNEETYEIVTDMKGGAVKPVNGDAQRRMESWRVTRKGREVFEMELKTSFGGRTDRYEVSSDGKTMTLYRHPTDKHIVLLRNDKDGTVRRLTEYVLVFDHLE